MERLRHFFILQQRKERRYTFWRSFGVVGWMVWFGLVVPLANDFRRSLIVRSYANWFSRFSGLSSSSHSAVTLLALSRQLALHKRILGSYGRTLLLSILFDWIARRLSPPVLSLVFGANVCKHYLIANANIQIPHHRRHEQWSHYSWRICCGYTKR